MTKQANLPIFRISSKCLEEKLIISTLFPSRFLHSHFHLLIISIRANTPTSPCDTFHPITHSSSIISLPLRGWFPVKWPRAPSSRDACIQGTSGKKEPESRRWEPHTWLRNFYYSVDPNTGRGRIMAAWLPWEIQIQSVVTRLDLLEPRANARTKDRAHHASRRPTGNARNATVTFHVRSCCVCTWNTARPRSLSDDL